MKSTCAVERKKDKVPTKAAEQREKYKIIHLEYSGLLIPATMPENRLTKRN
jgi:hypothetical protein